ncbi:MAG TPA: hypothetical protein ENI95_13650 [Chloroflexi bacterium]|nr:hypothetical protein [Chloroflexota bacterium]
MRTSKLRIWLLGAVLLVLGTLLAGCGSSSRAVLTGSSWPGFTVADDVVYIAFGPQVYAVDLATTNPIWSFPEEPQRGQAFYAPPAVDDDLVVVGDYTNMLFALDRETGREVWSFQSGRARFIGGAVIGEEYVYAGAVDGTFYALDRETGEEVWSFAARRDIWSTPLLIGDTVYVTSLDRHLYALDARTGDLRWQFPAPGEEDREPIMGALVGTPTLYEGVLYFGSFNNHVYALDAGTQEVLWTFQTTNWVWSSPAIDEENNLLVGGDLDGLVFALDRETGESVWTFDTDGPIVGTPALGTLSDGTRVAYVTSGDSNLYMLSIEDGTPVAPPVSVKAEFTTRFLVIPTGVSIRPVPVYAPPVLYDDVVLVGVHQGESLLYAFDRETLLERWTFEPPTD